MCYCCHRLNGKINVISCKCKVSDKILLYFWNIYMYICFYVICTNFKRDISGKKYVVLNYTIVRKLSIFKCNFCANLSKN